MITWPNVSRISRIEKLRTLLQRRAYAELVDEVSSRLLPAGNPVLYWDRLVIVTLSDARPPRRRPDQDPVPATSEDIEALCLERPDRRALIENRVREGQRCFVIRDDGKIVARQWVVSDRPVFETNSGLRFVPPVRPALWCHDIFVDPAYRMRGYFVSMMLNALSLGGTGEKQDSMAGATARPRPHLYGEIHFLNQASIRAHLSFGYRVIRTVTVVSALGLKVYRIEDDEGNSTVQTRHAWRVRHI